MTELSAAKKALLAKWLKGKEKGACAIPRHPGPAPLSIMQQRLWFMEQLVPGTAAFNITHAIRLRGRLAPGLLEQALTEIVARHETLRVQLVPGPGGEPVQQVTPATPVHLTVEAAADAELQSLLDAEAARPIDMRRDPLYRFRLLRLAPAEHALFVTIHHIVADGWSISLFARELLVLYEAFAAGSPSPLPALAVSYGDFAAWQREQADFSPDLAWWKAQLAGPLPVLELPTDFPRPPVQSYRGRQHHFAISPELTEAVQRLGQREGLTPFMICYAAFAALLHRYSGQAEILCGTPVANRNRPEVEGLIGFFVNTLVMRTDLTGEPSFRELARRVREYALGAFAHQELPFEKLVEELAPRRSLSHQPLFQVVFNLVMGLREEVQSSLGAELIVGSTGTAQFDLMLALFQEGGGFSAHFEYSTDLFRPETIGRMAGHYLTLLAAAVADPECPVGALPLLTPAETADLAAWGSAPADYPRGEAVHRLFAAEAARQPEAPALVWDGGSISYGELDRQSNRLAGRLRRLGVGVGALVGIAAERSPALIVGLLGILKAGGAYVPLDPAYPADRLAFMLADTGLTVLLAQPHLAAKLPAHEAQVVLLDSAQDESDSPVEADLADGESPAYVIYTSGSTGRPKGSLVPHRAIIRLVKGANFADLGPEQVFLQLAPVSFDASTLEIWGALLNGGRIALMPSGTPSLEELAGAIRRFGVTTLWLTAGLFHLMVEQQLEALLTVRQILAGGDVLSAAHVRRVLAALPPDGRLINGYGPTENTTFTCCFPMTGQTALDGSVPIGRPISNTSVRVLDRQGQPVPVGVPGELYAGGDGLALGYLNRPELTAERFITIEGTRCYRTGDLVRWLPDGNLEFLGRLDDQVKIRGFRVELGEIAFHLGQCPGVADAAVIAREDRPGEKRLVAYYTGPAAQAELRGWLKDRLPEYMLPAACIQLEVLPLGPNGKVDRRALPAPEAVAVAEPRAFTAPRTPAEAQMAAIWAEVLGLPQVSIDADFFEIGGHSLLAIRLLSRVREAFGAELPLRTLFEHPTVAELAGTLHECPPAAPGVAAPRLALPEIHPDPSGAGLPFPQTYVQQAYLAGRSGYFDMGACGTNFVSEFAVTGGGRPFLERFQHALRRLIARHDSLRTFMLPDGRQQVLPDPGFDLPVIDLREMTPAEADARLEADRHRMKYDKAPVDRWPLFEFAAYLMADGQIRILSRIDALILDGTSNSLFLKELFRLLEEPETDLAPYACSFRDYVLALQAVRETERYARSRRYWLERVKELPPAPAFPMVVPPSPTVESRPVGRGGVLLDPPAYAQFKARTARNGLTPSAAVLTALAEVIAAWSASPRFTISLVASYRLPFHPEIQQMVGNFNSITLLGIDAGGGSFKERAHRLQVQLSTDLEHMYFPGFEALQEWRRLQGAGTRTLSPVLANSLIEYSHSVYEARQLDRDGAATPDGSIAVVDGHFTIPQITFEPIFGVEPDGSFSAWWVSLDAIFPPNLFSDMLTAFTALVRRLAAESAAWEEGPLRLATPPAPQPAATNDLEQQMAALWAEVLGTGPVGPEDDLFTLGATSLLAIRLIAAVEQRFGCRLPVTILADDPTVRGFARAAARGG